METIDGLLSKYERQALGYWDFMTQQEREQYAWLAGIIDGEGCIRAVRYWNKKTKSLQHDLNVFVSMLHALTIDSIRNIAGVGCTYSECEKPNRKRMYRWVCSNREAASVLRKCLPYLITKRAQALLALEFMETKCLSGQRPTQAQLAKREALIEAIKRLKSTSGAEQKE